MTLSITRDEDCPECGWPETYVKGTLAAGPERVGCRKCGWSAAAVPRSSEVGRSLSAFTADELRDRYGHDEGAE